jgi:hypothetical protein
MSVFQFNATGILPLRTRITGNTVTSVLSATNNVLFVPWFQVNEINGGTHNLTVDTYDGTNSVYLGDDSGLTWTAKAVTAKASYRFTQGLVIPIGSSLRITSSDAAGYFHVHGVYVIVTG